MGTLHEEPCKFMIISRLILIKVINISDRICRENKNTSCVQFLFLSVPKIVPLWKWKNMAAPDSPRLAIRRRYLWCWMSKVQTVALGICNTNCCFTINMVARTRLIVTLILPVFLNITYSFRWYCGYLPAEVPYSAIRLALTIASEARQQLRTTTTLVAGQDFVSRPSVEFHHGGLQYDLTVTMAVAQERDSPI
jgi:hypothetical protein